MSQELTTSHIATTGDARRMITYTLCDPIGEQIEVAFGEAFKDVLPRKGISHVLYGTPHVLTMRSTGTGKKHFTIDKMELHHQFTEHGGRYQDNVVQYLRKMLHERGFPVEASVTTADKRTHASDELDGDPSRFEGELKMNGVEMASIGHHLFFRTTESGTK